MGAGSWVQPKLEAEQRHHILRPATASYSLTMAANQMSMTHICMRSLAGLD